MDTTIYNDIKRLYKFIFKNKISFLIFLTIYILIAFYLTSFKTSLIRTEVILKINHIDFDNTHLEIIFKKIKNNYNYSNNDLKTINEIKFEIKKNFILLSDDKMKFVKETLHNDYNKYEAYNEFTNYLSINNIFLTNIEHITKDIIIKNHLFIYYDLSSFTKANENVEKFNAIITDKIKKLISDEGHEINGKYLKSHIKRKLSENGIYIDKDFLNNLDTNFFYLFDFNGAKFYKEIKFVIKNFIYLISSFIFFFSSFIAIKEIKSES